MAHIYFDSSYISCGFLIVTKDGNPYNEKDTVLIQTDWDYPSVATTMGWTPCKKCRATDGTVSCEHRSATEMISEALAFIQEHEEEEFESLEEYFQ